MAKKPSIVSRVKRKADAVMAGPLKMGPTPIKMVHHYTEMLMEQLKAMLPITLLQASTTELSSGTAQRSSWRWVSFKKLLHRGLAAPAHTAELSSAPAPPGMLLSLSLSHSLPLSLSHTHKHTPSRRSS